MKALVVLSVLGIAVISGHHLPRASAETAESHKCYYDGQMYNIGDLLPTRHMCLNCTCSKEFLEPSNVYCDVIHCVEAPELNSGCIPVYDDSECCPVTWNCSEPTCQCDKRYLEHYGAKGCEPVYSDGCDCPVRYNCEPSDGGAKDDPVCHFQSRTYQKGEDIPSSNPCDICTCREGANPSAAEISCITIECPRLFGPRLNSSCYHVYEKDKCCPETKCSTDDVVPRTEKVCEHGGKTYRLGEHIYPDEQPCLTCTCNEQWTGVDENSCSKFDCMLEKKRRDLLEGCVPIYHETTCCPIEMYCGSPEEGFKNLTVPQAEQSDKDSGMACAFRGMHYKLGQVLEINHPTNCVTCTCSTPPDFTCVHKSCPRPPNDDYVNCKASFPPGECCPTYQCPQSAKPRKQAAPRLIQCSPVHCPVGCSEVTVSNSCPFCKCDDIMCSPPKCAPGCKVQEDGPPGMCPGCDCPVLEPSAGVTCDPVSCLPHCHQVLNPDGCMMCVCGPLCSPPKCDPGCTLEREVPEGECPRCVCPNSKDQKVQCAPVQCPATCRQEIGSSGCASCACDPMCSPLKCDEGCYIDPHPQGICPGCICPDKDVPPSLQCAPVECGPLCHVAYFGPGCPTCICDPLCSTPHCDPGCRLTYDPQDGPCPRCDCGPKDYGSVICTPPQCEPGCHVDFSTRPCPKCSCDNLVGGIQCSTPSCAPCRINYDSKPCPSCECAGNETDYDPLLHGVQCSPPQCDEPECHVDYSATPCPDCVCDGSKAPTRILCSPPRCDPGCSIDYSTQPCPSCKCGPGGIPSVMCSPPSCGPGCHVDYSTQPCPSCDCLEEDIMCSPPKCEGSCTLDYSTKPCPSCKCEDQGIMCSPPKCDPGCTVDYSTKPCPSCYCQPGTPKRVMCSTPKCDPGCTVDFSTQPCPSCSCTPEDVPRIMCSPPKCDPGCSIDYSSKPCPSCSCGSRVSDVPRIMCSPPKCDPGCTIDYSTKPCPSCSCGSRVSDVPRIMCSSPKCDAECVIDYTTKPCPSCSCDSGDVPEIMCSPPKCEPGCGIDYSTAPCPSCKCGDTVQTLQCSSPKCDPGCEIDFDTKPCPSCFCKNAGKVDIQCSPVKCNPGCKQTTGDSGCPACDCDPLACVVPKCDSGCDVDFTAQPCPTCKCMIQPRRPASRVLPRQMPMIPMGLSFPNIYLGNDPYCAQLKCGPGCRMSQDPPPPNERCPSCICEGRLGSRVTCAPTQCQLPCRFERFSQYACPTCICFPIPCTQLNCSPGYVERTLPEQRCPVCVREGSEKSR